MNRQQNQVPHPKTDVNNTQMNFSKISLNPKEQDKFLSSIYDPDNSLHESYEIDIKDNNDLRNKSKEEYEQHELLNQRSLNESPSLYQEVSQQYVTNKNSYKLKISIKQSQYISNLLSPFYFENSNAQTIQQNLEKIQDDKSLKQIFDGEDNKDSEIIIKLLLLLHKYAQIYFELGNNNQCFITTIQQDDHLKKLDFIYKSYQEYIEKKQTKQSSYLEHLYVELEENFFENLLRKLYSNSN